MKRPSLWWLPPIAAVVLTVLFYHEWQHWLAYGTGSYNTAGAAHNYNFFSGFGSDLGEYTLVGVFTGHLMVLWKTHTCHYVWWCWRSPKYQLGDTPHMLCHRHHPDEQVSVKDAIARYKAAS